MAKKNANGDAVDERGRVIVATQPGPVKKTAAGDDIATAVPASGALAPRVENKAWGAEGIAQADIIIPKLLLMQPLSQFVEDEKAKAGDIVRSTTGTALADVRVVPISTFKTWVVEEQVGGKFEFRETVPVTAKNADAPLEWEQNGTRWQRSRVLNFYVLLVSDVEREAKAMQAFAETGDFPDTEDALIPHLVSFRRTSYKAGKELVTHFAKAAHFNVPPASKTFELKVKKEKNEKGFYFVYEVAPVAGKTAPDVLAMAKKWYETLRTSSVQIHEDAERVETQAERRVAPQAFEDEVNATF